MSDENIHDINKRQVNFTIDGRQYNTKDRQQSAAALLTLAELDPTRYDLGELRPDSHDPIHFSDDQIVEIENKARFVSIRHCADVA